MTKPIKQTKPNNFSNFIEPKTEGQQIYFDSIYKNQITIVTSCAGTGKSAIAVGIACKMLKEEKIKKIVLTRPTISTGKGIGFLPGNINEKMSPYLLPLYEEAKKYFPGGKLNGLIGVASEFDSPTIEIAPFEVMRGRSFGKDTFVIGDELQNATYEQLKMLVTRIGEGTKLVITGDLNQCDLPVCDLMDFARRASKVDGVNWVTLTNRDVVRSKIVRDLLEVL